ncbi:fumarylacetoacetate hydrolase family protein [Proteiniclasticum ruminis]|uniref:2-keto-4-pentenoate hydratase/2-oxohepta-3-ene-1,7-dioic acid hydratase (Catechol pathway) n=1 Tax=Proteiniclasticum ruminis TaxID=398199 RepID=A0A1I5BVR8_9CLOT|nr:fumarylacetoacetate hydrolase family protein [Proteiniclasticum ruminis]SFN78702.1 2-keto-4-pentenoate hydratase/2-oxohepta-3-ene-1,7-dioic acid hydratase (catechol pathway) [Proteiniclasticum ruminis]
MKFVWYEKDGEKRLGVLHKEESHIISLEELLPMRGFQDLVDFIERYTTEDLNLIRRAMEKDKTQGTPVTKVRILSPIERPRHDIICVGVNYEAHLKESTLGLKDPKLDGPKEPVYFSKRAVRILGTEEPIEGFFSLDEALDYEVELAVLIGKEGRDIPKEKVKEHIFGYTVFNDVSSRTLQKSHIQWYKGKSLDTHSILGPYVLFAEDAAYPPDFTVETRVNGELRQKSSTRLFIHDVDKLISDFSRGITLEPGDIIATGTPSGVGMGFTPPKFLKSGDLVECSISGIGILRNKVR